MVFCLGDFGLTPGALMRRRSSSLETEQLLVPVWRDSRRFFEAARHMELGERNVRSQSFERDLDE